MKDKKQLSDSEKEELIFIMKWFFFVFLFYAVVAGIAYFFLQLTKLT